MRFLDDGNTMEFRFTHSSLIIDRGNQKIKYKKQETSFQDVRGFWKNFVLKRKKKYYYVVLLTRNWMTPITPEMDEYDVDEVIHYLIEFFGEDKYAR